MSNQLNPADIEGAVERSWERLRKATKKWHFKAEDELAIEFIQLALPYSEKQVPGFEAALKKSCHLKIAAQHLARGKSWETLPLYIRPPESEPTERMDEVEESAPSPEGDPSGSELVESLKEAGVDPQQKQQLPQSVGEFLPPWPKDLKKPDPCIPEGCYNCYGKGHRYPECPEPRVNIPFCRICGRRPFTVRTCPACGPFWRSEAGCRDRDLRRRRQ